MPYYCPWRSDPPNIVTFEMLPNNGPIFMLNFGLRSLKMVPKTGAPPPADNRETRRDTIMVKVPVHVQIPQSNRSARISSFLQAFSSYSLNSCFASNAAKAPCETKTIGL